jgi:hypothetical protein
MGRKPQRRFELLDRAAAQARGSDAFALLQRQASRVGERVTAQLARLRKTGPGKPDDRRAPAAEIIRAHIETELGLTVGAGPLAQRAFAAMGQRAAGLQRGGAGCVTLVIAIAAAVSAAYGIYEFAAGGAGGAGLAAARTPLIVAGALIVAAILSVLLGRFLSRRLVPVVLLQRSDAMGWPRLTGAAGELIVEGVEALSASALREELALGLAAWLLADLSAAGRIRDAEAAEAAPEALADLLAIGAFLAAEANGAAPPAAVLERLGPGLEAVARTFPTAVRTEASNGEGPASDPAEEGAQVVRSAIGAALVALAGGPRGLCKDGLEKLEPA